MFLLTDNSFKMNSLCCTWTNCYCYLLLVVYLDPVAVFVARPISNLYCGVWALDTVSLLCCLLVAG
jgi:hypothetical protein